MDPEVAVRHVLLGILLAAVATLTPLRAGTWEPIPPEVWTMKDSTSGSKGAVILSEWARYGIYDTEVRMRVRIFGEEGKGAASIPWFSSNIREFEGRTVQPDGRITVFSSQKDLVTSHAKWGSWESKEKRLIPPGLTGDCLVDLHYRIGTYLWGTWVEIPVLQPYPVKKKVMEMITTSGLGSVLMGFRDIKPSQATSGSYRIYTFDDLPADEQEPFSILTANDRPRFLFFLQPRGLRDVSSEGPEAYWKEVSRLIYKERYTSNLDLGSTYKKWSKELRKDLAGDRLGRAAEILVRLENQIQNNSRLTHAEAGALTKKEAAEDYKASDLDSSVKRRRTNGMGMHFLFYQLLVDEGLEPKILEVADRENRVFLYKLPNIFQFTSSLIGVEGANGLFGWFDPTSRYCPPGIIHPNFQGTNGLLIDPKDWSCKLYFLPPQVAPVNRSRFDYTLSLGEEERFSVEGTFSGYPEYLERSNYLHLDSSEQVKALKERMEARLKGYILTQAKVENATDARANLAWRLEGVREVDDESRRVQPFPGLPMPMRIPTAWPDKRQNAIVFPYCQQVTATCRFLLPKGWRLTHEVDMEEKNSFGQVSWKSRLSSRGEDAEVEVTLVVTASRMFSPASEYESFKRYIGWVESATRRTLSLERP